MRQKYGTASGLFSDMLESFKEVRRSNAHHFASFEIFLLVGPINDPCVKLYKSALAHLDMHLKINLEITLLKRV